MGGFVLDCHTQTFVEVAKLELKMDNKFRRPRVSGWEEDGRFISVEYTQENGERVEGVFERIGWDRPPNRLLVKFHEAMRNGPIHIIGSKRAPQ
jgi:hypothetical protein